MCRMWQRRIQKCKEVQVANRFISFISKQPNAWSRRLRAMAHFLQRFMNSDLAQGLSSKKGLLIALVLGALLCLAAAGAVVKLNAAATCAVAVDNSSSNSSSSSSGSSESQVDDVNSDVLLQQASPPINTAVTTGMFALACIFAAYSAALCTFATRAAQSST